MKAPKMETDSDEKMDQWKDFEMVVSLAHCLDFLKVVVKAWTTVEYLGNLMATLKETQRVAYLVNCLASQTA